MKTPPFLLLAALLFWGWLSDFLLAGAIMGVILEGTRYTKFRWDLDDSDFNRISSFCLLLIVASMGYAITNNDAGGLSGMLHGNTGANALKAGALTATRWLRWLPMATFAFITAQAFNTRPSVPLTAISMVLRWRRRKGDRTLAGHFHDISYPYFMVCLISAGIHTNTGSKVYFVGLCGLTGWALWSVRPRRFKVVAWVAALAGVAVLGLFGIVGINHGQRMLQTFDSQLLARLLGNQTDPLQTMTSMGRIGNMKLSAKIVIWLEPRTVGNAPEYLREASYRNYSAKNATWYAGGVRNDFDVVAPEADNTSWVLVPGKTNAAAVNIACYLNGRSPDHDPQGLLPLPSGCSRLENLPAISSVIALQKNKTGAVLATGSGLMIFDARFGPGSTLDAPPDIDSTNPFDLTVPANEVPALDKVIAEMDLAATNHVEIRRAVEKFFLDKFTYSTWQGKDKRGDTNGTPLTKFLLTSRRGHCEYFASATVLLLRRLGVPARYAVGYYVHEPHGSGYVVRERDGHAWCLAWNAATRAWEDFDTTPPSWVATESRRTEFGEWLSDLRSWLGFQFERFRWRQANLQQYILWALVPVMLVLLYHIIFRRRGKLLGDKDKPGKIPAVIWPGLDSEFYGLERMLAARGLPRQASEPFADWLERTLTEPALAGLRAPLQELLRLHYRHRFDPRGLSSADRERLRQEAKTCLEVLLQSKAR